MKKIVFLLNIEYFYISGNRAYDAEEQNLFQVEVPDNATDKAEFIKASLTEQIKNSEKYKFLAHNSAEKNPDGTPKLKFEIKYLREIPV
jgi:hypothetical protein